MGRCVNKALDEAGNVTTLQLANEGCNMSWKQYTKDIRGNRTGRVAVGDRHYGVIRKSATELHVYDKVCGQFKCIIRAHVSSRDEQGTYFVVKPRGIKHTCLGLAAAISTYLKVVAESTTTQNPASRNCTPMAPELSDDQFLDTIGVF